MICFAPLWAQGLEELVGIVIVILFLVVPAVLQLLSKKGQAQRPGGGVRPAARPPKPEVEDEIAEFLRRAAERPGAGQPAPPPPARPAGPPVMAQVVDQRPDQPEAARQQPLGNQLRRHLGEYLDSGDFTRRAAELGEEVAQADEQIEDRLHRKFDRDVSRLAATPGASAEAPGVAEAAAPAERVAEIPPAAAAGLPMLFSTAENIRQAIIINEILNRPEHRWT